MPTFRQTHTHYEDGFGAVRVLVVMSDTFAGLFATVSTIETNVFLIDSSKKDLELSKGRSAQDELTLKVDVASAQNDDDLDACAFFRDAQDPATPRYVAVFMNTAELPTAPDIDDCEFIGQVETALKAKDTRHYGDEWSVALNPLREWEGSAATLMDISFDDIKLKDLIYGNDDEDVTGIDSTWETNFVGDKLGYFKSPASDPHGMREARFEKLVDLSKLLRKLADNVEQTLTDRGLGTFNIYIDDIIFDFKMSPARYNPAEGYSYVAGVYVFAKTRILKGFPEGHPVDIKTGDMYEFGIGDSFQETFVSPSIHYRMVKPQSGAEKSLAFDRFQTFPDLLYAIAETFNLYVRFIQTSPTDVHISWISRSSMAASSQVYIRDSSAGSLDLSINKAGEEDTTHNGLATTFAADGHDWYVKQGSGAHSPTYYYNLKQGKGVLPVFTVSATLATIVYPASDARQLFGLNRRGFIPHNVVYYTGSTQENIEANPDRATLGITTALYLYVPQSGEYIDDHAGRIYLPAAAVHAQVDGADKMYASLSDFVNEVGARDIGYFNAEYELTVPFLNGFSLSADGSSPSWKNIGLGARVVIEEEGDPREFVVVGIERNYANIETKLRLHLSSRMAYSPPGDIGDDVPLTPPINTITSPSEISAEPSATYVAVEEIEVGDAVAVDHEDTGVTYVRRAVANRIDFGRILGIALVSAEEDDPIEVRSTGRISSSAFAFVPGKRVYVRSSTLPTVNISQSFLTGPSDTEDMVAFIGFADTPNSMVVEIFQQYVYSEVACPCG